MVIMAGTSYFTAAARFRLNPTTVCVAYTADMTLALVLVSIPNCWATLGISVAESMSPHPSSILVFQTMSPEGWWSAKRR